MTNLLQRFVDFATGEVTADVNNSKVTTDSATINNADGSTIDGDDIIGIPSSSTSVSPGFDTWTQADANRPTYLIISVVAETDGTSNGQVNLEVDESGGTTSDYSLRVVAYSSLGSGARNEELIQVTLPAGAQYQLNNIADPNNGNFINGVREVTL